ncbi:hypothetical protein E8E11_010530 [Didymella keratinophila]|nr:hypothetical protein E8E11_010530 [Didymella keratinophila]
MDQENPPEPIAIIGTVCRLPGGTSNPSKLWELLKNPRDFLRDIPRDRFHWEGVYRPDGLHGPIKTHSGCSLDENIREFDPDFFKLLPAEAENLDPQHRLLLENVYEAIESTGLRLKDLQGTPVGVFVGSMVNEYYENANHDVDAPSVQILTTGPARSMAANHISYTFDFRGPSLSMDTACSSSLMAVHLAVASLRRGESTVAFACGAHLILTPNYFKALSRTNMISADGRR